MLKLTIGKLNIRLDGVEAGQVPENTLLFCSDFQEADLEYTFRFGENPAVGAYPVVYRAKDIVVFGKPGGLEARLLYMPDSHICYAYYEEISEKATGSIYPALCLYGFRRESHPVQRAERYRKVHAFWPVVCGISGQGSRAER